MRTHTSPVRSEGSRPPATPDGEPVDRPEEPDHQAPEHDACDAISRHWTSIATMTGNVAQVFLEDDEWLRTLEAVRDVLRPGGYLVFESRRPERRGWLEWNREESFSSIEIDGVGLVDSWYDVIDVSLPLVTFRGTIVFHEDGIKLTSDSTLGFERATRSLSRSAPPSSGSMKFARRRSSGQGACFPRSAPVSETRRMIRATGCRAWVTSRSVAVTWASVESARACASRTRRGTRRGRRSSGSPTRRSPLALP